MGHHKANHTHHEWPANATADNSTDPQHHRDFFNTTHLQPQTDSDHYNASGIAHRPPSFYSSVSQTERTISTVFRLTALCLLLLALALAVRMLRSRRSQLFWALLACISCYLLGVALLTLQFEHIIQLSGIWTTLLGNDVLVAGSELYNWVLYLRFRNVAQFSPKLIQRVRWWLVFESVLAAANAAYWIVTAYARETHRFHIFISAGMLFVGINLLQTVTSVLLSSYFIWTYFWPAIRRSKHRLRAVGRRGLIYLVLEALLHLSFTVTELYSFLSHSQSIIVQTGVNNVASAVRLLFFMRFLWCIRRAVADDDDLTPTEHFHIAKELASSEPMSLFSSGVATNVPASTLADTTLDPNDSHLSLSPPQLCHTSPV
ncbi:hypothetical protein RI367_006095 [Sorochytrium milnesiophthora]